MELSPDSIVGLPGCATSKCGCGMLSELPRGHEQCFYLYITPFSFFFFLKDLQTLYWFYLQGSLTAVMQAPVGSNMTVIPQHSSSQERRWKKIASQEWQEEFFIWAESNYAIGI